MNRSIAQYLLDSMKTIGIKDVFGAPGDLQSKSPKISEPGDALKKVVECDCGAYIEVCMDKMASSELAA